MRVPTAARASTTEWQTELTLPGGAIACTLRRSARARRLRLTVDPRLATIVTVPARSARSRAEAERLAQRFAGEREPWLRRHLDRQARARAALGTTPLGDGTTLQFRGEAHRLRVQPSLVRGRRSTVSRCGADDGDELVVELAAGERRTLAATLETWLRERARMAIVREIDRHAAGLGVAPSAVTIRDQRTRWGSCSRSGHLSFSWRLILAPPEALETVVVHELAHLSEFGHGPAFWALVASRVPEHRHWRRWLREHSLELHAALGGGTR